MNKYLLFLFLPIGILFAKKATPVLIGAFETKPNQYVQVEFDSSLNVISSKTVDNMIVPLGEYEKFELIVKIEYDSSAGFIGESIFREDDPLIYTSDYIKKLEIEKKKNQKSSSVKMTNGKINWRSFFKPQTPEERMFRSALSLASVFLPFGWQGRAIFWVLTKFAPLPKSITN